MAEIAKLTLAVAMPGPDGVPDAGGAVEHGCGHGRQSPSHDAAPQQPCVGR
jgi:hypothetical protein